LTCREREREYNCVKKRLLKGANVKHPLLDYEKRDRAYYFYLLKEVLANPDIKYKNSETVDIIEIATNIYVSVKIKVFLVG
jgi:hypothetical protein